MKVIIAGGRNITDFNLLEQVIKKSDFDITEVVSGGASGIDSLGETWAISNNIFVRRFPADWDKYGKSAGPIRNRQMAEYANALILIWDGKSRGSASMLRLAKEAKLIIYGHIIE